MDASGGLGATTELSVKYQKLAAEYAKVKAQVSVLKKAMLEEQSQMAEFKEILKARDHTVRKNEQEMESLTFRNQQLTKRVTVLQEELDLCQHKSRTKGKGKGNTIDSSSCQPQLTNHILGEELQMKIEENARLHKRVSEVDQEHRRVISALESRVQELEHDASGHQNAIEKINANNISLIEKLQLEKSKLEAQLQYSEKELKEACFKVDVCEEQLRNVQQELGSQLKVASEIIVQKLPFVDTKCYRTNQLNVPTYSRRLHLKSVQFVEDVGAIIHDIVSGLSDLHTYSEQRALLGISGGNENGSSEVNKKLALHLHNNAPYLRRLEESFFRCKDDVRGNVFFSLEACKAFREFAQLLSNYVIYLKNLLSLQHLGVDEECRLSWCSVELQASNHCLKEAWQKFQSIFEVLETCVVRLSVERESSARHGVLTCLSQALRDLHNCVKEICVHHSEKLALEMKIPVLCERVGTTEECLVSSLASLVCSTGKLSTIVSDHAEEFFSNQSNLSRYASCWNADCGDIGHVVSFQRRASAYIANIAQECPESVPYVEAVENRRVLHRSTESHENVLFQLNTCEEKIKKLEQSREHWMLEYRLLHMKYEKLLKKSESLDRQGSLSGSEGSPVHELRNGGLASEPSLSVNNFQTVTSHLGKLVRNSSNDELQLESNDSDELRAYLVGRVNELVVHRQLAESKAAAFHSELSAMHKRLVLAEKGKSHFQDELCKANQDSGVLREELLITTNNYKTQLSMMSEHLASMNEKLTTQKDEIDSLRYSLNNAGNKKNKGK